jgi:hypothetical protein
MRGVYKTMRTMVEVFNQLTHNELADFTLFEELLGSHYEKFRFYYYNTDDIPNSVTKHVKGVSCYCSENAIVIVTEFKTSKNCTEYLSYLEPYLSFPGNEYFSFTAEIKSGKKLNISIENKSISGEDEIHEDRFNSY